MKNLLYSSFILLSCFVILACSNAQQANREAPAEDNLIPVTQDSASFIATDTVKPAVIKEMKIKTATAKGDTVAAQSTNTESTGVRTASEHEGAVKNPGANQAETDSIKKSKTKGKIKKQQ